MKLIYSELCPTESTIGNRSIFKTELIDRRGSFTGIDCLGFGMDKELRTLWFMKCNYSSIPQVQQRGVFKSPLKFKHGLLIASYMFTWVGLRINSLNPIFLHTFPIIDRGIKVHCYFIYFWIYLHIYIRCCKRCVYFDLKPHGVKYICERSEI